MDLNEVKDGILKSLKDQGFKAYNAKGNTGDFRIFPAGKAKRVLVLPVKGTKLMTSLNDVANKIKQSLNTDCEIILEADRFSFANQTWTVKEKPKKAPKEVIKPSVTTQTSTTSSANEEVKEKVPPAPKSGDFNTELLRFAAITNKLEEVLDQFTLNTKSLPEFLGYLYDRFKKEGVEVYTTTVGIKVESNTFIIPHLTKEAFIAIGVKAIKPPSA